MFGLNMWWNLKILRDMLKVGGQSHLIPLSPAGVSRACASSLLRFHCPLCQLVGIGVSGRSKETGKEEVLQPRSLSLKNRQHHRHRCEVKTILTGETYRPASVCISLYRFSLNPICPTCSSHGSSRRWLYKR